MNWKEIDSLKKLDKVDKNNLKEEIFRDLLSIFDEKVKNNEELIQFIKTLSLASSEKKNLFFISEEAKYIYILTQLQGEARKSALKITKKMVIDKNAAKKWRDEINLIIHTDRSIHPLAKEAIQQLDEIYKDLIRA